MHVFIEIPMRQTIPLLDGCIPPKEEPVHIGFQVSTLLLCTSNTRLRVVYKPASELYVPIFDLRRLYM
jgi:hypothetical protein